MKRTLLLMFVALVLTACSNDKDESTDATENAAQETEQSNKTGETGESETSTNEADEEAEEDASRDINHRVIKDLEEYDVIADHIGLDSYKSIVETDNKGNRVILFEDDSGAKEYKSVFVTSNKCLKIISLKDDKLLFDETID